MKKAVRIISMLLVLMLCVSSFVGCGAKKPNKEDIFRVVEDNKHIFAADVIKKDYTDTMEVGTVAMVIELEHCINFSCGGYGISASSHNFGFYYSYDGQPYGVFETEEWGTAADLTEDGQGYAGDFGGNDYYTEKICDQFWYYEMHT